MILANGRIRNTVVPKRAGHGFMDDAERYAGGCLCGGVRFAVAGGMREVVACHCGQCRRFHGNFGAYTACREDGLRIEEAGGLAWYASSDRARRGFCRNCGSSLFWKPSFADFIAVAAGALDDTRSLKLARHIFTGDVPGWYAIADGLEQVEQSMSGM